MDSPRSPLALPFPHLPAVAGVDLRVGRAGYKAWDRSDLMLAKLARDTVVAGVFTRSACASFEVERGREQVHAGRARALIVNAGNSNAFTGARGRDAVLGLQRAAAARLGCAEDEVFVCSTGVIGVPLPLERGLRGLADAFGAPPCSWQEAAQAIGTTDTFAKGATARAMIGGHAVSVAGIVKGSGMIAPDMATMLGFVFTDATVAPDLLQEMLAKANDQTFSCITVDGDTSTSDTVLVFATGQAQAPALKSWDDSGADAFYAALLEVCRNLAQLVVRDGEGARKFVTIRVSGAVDEASARRVGLAIGNSPLVKTAIAGEDANWGRVVMAVGKAGEPADRDRLAIAFGGRWVARDGCAVPALDETAVTEHLRGADIEIAVDLGLGRGAATVWTCDLTHGYISINADYRS
ncbi:bifunctional glutamate N-acetyltransferase/amino-acid acetyltransferase ArgJ [Erythrobacteraceae bacterium CFH 75059]|uniref:bifunctional glutamate N-acetyltransferase/amino-acid acetyltransferase ArgJ n=1 Tax=Qipengyuania thermophila TaxID=2509361 RepID=UPI00101FF616|nr:bifunctional glutamate N-acetyltransferase/amino-acid acetyltransferase ArgJ [Qipengyuania thermophila]TCD05059.1 bifunctional glutamate N-acetyltransferase/amino-acid acetyltransferase ArgJ [Erythrobacteraceae bacterium CFH 75059]